MAQQPQAQSESPLMTIILVILIACGVLYGIWTMGHTSIAAAIRGLRAAEMAVIGIFDPSYWEIRRYVLGMDAAAIRWDDLVAMSRAVGGYIRWPAAILLGAAGLWAMTSSPPTKWRRAMGLEELIQVQSNMWPVITPITKVNPVKKTRKPGGPVPRKLDAWAEALAPEEWIAFNQVKVENGQMNPDEAKAAFVKQLGPRWQGFEAADVHVQCLIAAFALKAARLREDSRAFLGDVAIWMAPQNTGLVAALARALDKSHWGRWLACRLDHQIRTRRVTEKELAELLADEDLMAPVRTVASLHGFESTALIGLLAWARERGGVLGSGEFLWLKYVERRLWYPLNGLGGQAFLTEASGAMAHYMAEIAEGNAINRPRVDAAVESLQAWLDKTKAKIPPLEDA